MGPSYTPERHAKGLLEEARPRRRRPLRAPHDDAAGKAAPASAGTPLVQGIFKVGLVIEDFAATVMVRDNSANLIQFFGR
jgi:hypothetical protein